MIAKRLLRRKKPDLVKEVFSSEKGSQDGPLSPQENLEGYSGLLKLATDLRENYLKGGAMRSQRFLPNDKLEELVTKKIVLLALQETTIEQQYHEDLASWVLESGKRLFLILVLLTRRSAEQLSWLKKFKNDGINDSVLPLGFPDTEPCYGYSLAAAASAPAQAQAQAEDARKFHSFKDWEDNNLILFQSYQWMFLAPVFGSSDKFCHQLSSEQPLPFLTLSERPTRGALGKTLYGELHPAHIDSQCLLALGVNGPDLQVIPVSIKLVQPSDNLHPFFDIGTGNFKAAHPIISPRRIRPIAAYKKNGDSFVIFRWVEGGNP
ncbi:hypothetical protein GQX73_g6992 [Xylaria multiplex]|uniref:Uncharacterized protein n=1 Tax=Xylaria multiplex TaxID=323545 RepID=A0A7C8ILF8_9PEZI|nr:hypothetical protein GQX73_g6992 [Xylaria multiplex]